MKFKLYKSDGSSSSDTELSNFPTLDDGKGVDALRQCIIAVRANQRQGNASTKTRDEVSGRSGEGFPENSNWSGVTRS
jgi:large subunit ribosomal protein L4